MGKVLAEQSINSPRIAPYGAWESPLDASAVATAGRRLADVVVDDTDIYWGETRPDEGGRVTIMRHRMNGEVSEVLPAPFNARSRVHEYGGGAFTVLGGTVYFSNFADQRLYRLEIGKAPVALTADGPYRYADGRVDQSRNKLICVREDHTDDHAPRNEIVAVDLATGAPRVLVTGADFYAFPRLNPLGNRLCWIAWNHPKMPWDGTTLSVAEITHEGTLTNIQVIAGSPTESIYGPQWSPSGDLHFVSDRTGRWNLYKSNNVAITPLWPYAAEFGLPLWNFATSTYAFSGSDIICVFGPAGARQLALIPAQGAPVTIPMPYAELGNVCVANSHAVMIAASPAATAELISVDLRDNSVNILHQPSTIPLPVACISTPTAITFPSTQGDAYGFYYAPLNPNFVAPPDERPPLIVICHGGPTSSTSTAFSAAIQYWTTRGFAVLDVNYGGSTGYGRAYRERLNGNWGVVDVSDCENAARFVAARGDADLKRMVIRGGSAGGYTTLCALTFGDVFCAGASHYGIGDLEALAKDTHKFEARYLDGLIGPYPERRDIYIARSPIHHIEKLKHPMILLQGLEDKVVPPQQAEAMVAALRAKGVPVAYVPFAGEQHGFRRAENIVRALEAELYFYGRLLGFEPAGTITPVQIDNLPN